MPTPYFVADAAQVTVMRSLASTAFGTYDLVLPEGITLEDLYALAAPGNKLGYVAALGGERVGGMARRFVRSDVSITTAMGEQEPATNVEEVLDAAAKRTSGDFFLETDISKAGLGPWIPFKDFQVGDKARVEIWGTVVTLPITRIDDDVVHVGGQLVSDADARLAENEIVRRALVDDRRDLFGLDEKIDSSVSSATKEWDGRLEDTASSLNDNLDAATKTWGEQLNSTSTEWRAQLEALEEGFVQDYGVLESHLGEAIEDAEAHSKKLEALTRALQGENQDLDAASKLVLQRIQNLTDTANTAGDWVAENQDDVNKAIALALSAQGQYNEFNNIKWFKDEEWKEQQVKINQSNLLFQKMQEQVNGLYRVQFIDLYEWRKQVNELQEAQDAINLANRKFQAWQQNYNEMNDYINQVQNNVLQRLSNAHREMSKAVSNSVDELMATKAGSSHPKSSVTSRVGGEWRVNFPPTDGQNLVHVSWYTKGSNSLLSLGGEKLYSNLGSFTCSADVDYLYARWSVTSSNVESINRSISNTSVGHYAWETLLSQYISGGGKNLYMDANITWKAASRGATYGIRLVLNGTVIGETRTTSLGPATILGEGERSQTVVGTRNSIPRGSRLELQAISGAGAGFSRGIKSAAMSGTYTT